MRDPSRLVFCLLVEDDPLVGLDLADALEAAGCYVAGPFRFGREAMRWLACFTPDVAVIDLMLADGPCRGLVPILKARGVPFLVCSGDPPCRSPDPALSGTPRFEKPVSTAAIAAALHNLIASSPGINGIIPLAASQHQ